MDRRTFSQAAAAMITLAGVPAVAAGTVRRQFPSRFLWGASTSGHQTEGNNVASDFWHMEHCAKSMFAEASGDAADSFNRWPHDLDLAKSLHLNSYRFSLEWARIEPEEGKFSDAMLEHYRSIVEGCKARGLAAVVTFNHFSCPRWFAARGGWSNPAAPDLFARYCAKAAQAIAAHIDYAVTMNEPNLPSILAWANMPGQLYEAHAAMLAECARSLGVADFSAGFLLPRAQFAPMIPVMGAAHRKARAAIKSVRPDLPVGLSLAVTDDQGVGTNSKLNAKRAEAYQPWFEFGAQDDFVGVQNYDRMLIDANGPVAPPAATPRNFMGTEIYPASLQGAVRYVHTATGKPVLVTEHGLGTDDDALRRGFITDSLAGLHQAIVEGVPVLGYMHWSLIDNFEWYFGFQPKFGLATVDRLTQKRTLKPSSAVLARIARSNRV